MGVKYGVVKFAGYGTSACLVFFSILLLTSGCSTVGYYSQSITGHLKVWSKRHDIENLIAAETTSPGLKKQLKKIIAMRHFATSQLELPNNYSFKSYADIKRSHIVWNVIAAPEFSTEPKKWCFPVVGCLSYIGYFAKHKAVALGKEMKQKGYDVIVGGVTAYSTLGWFSDPVLSTYVNSSDPELAGLIFHELAHQIIYVKGDTTFNESFATAVELYGIDRWMAKRGTPEVAKRYARYKKYERQFHAFILLYRQKFKTVYARNIPDERKRALKKQVIAQMQLEYKQRRKRWKGYKDYDAWMAAGINNAKLAIFATYYNQVPAFSNLIRQKKGDMNLFFQAVKRLGAMDKEQRDIILGRLGANNTENSDSAKAK